MARIAASVAVALLLTAAALTGCGGGTNLAFCGGGSSLNSSSSNVTVDINTGQCPTQTTTGVTAAMTQEQPDAQALAAPPVK